MQAWTAPRCLRVYLRALGMGLFVQGVVTVVTRAVYPHASEFTHDLINASALHGSIHVVWGAVLLGLLVGHADDRALAGAAIIFGIFYTAFAVLGLFVHHPLGIHLGAGENGLHLIIGPPALILGLLVRRALGSPTARPDTGIDPRMAGVGK